MNKSQLPDTRIAYTNWPADSRHPMQFVPAHILWYQVSGTLIVNDGNSKFSLEKGSLTLLKRNSLLKISGKPFPREGFKSLSIFLDHQSLQRFAGEYLYKSQGSAEISPVIEVLSHPLLSSYVNSLLPYEHMAEPFSGELLSLKLKEAILILIQTNPALKEILFDFREPLKAELHDFMNHTFRFNIPLKDLAYLSGRSLAGFKRDFGKIFGMPPARWLQQRRLEEAYFLIRKKGKTASGIYQELGFEDLSHFSFAFRKKFGVPPSRIFSRQSPV